MYPLTEVAERERERENGSAGNGIQDSILARQVLNYRTTP